MLTNPIKQTSEYKRLLAAVQSAGGTALFGLPAVGRVAVAAALWQDTGRPILVVTADEAQATHFVADAQALELSAEVYPARDFVMRNIEGQSREYEYRRLQVMGQLAGKRVQMVVAPIEAVLQRTLPPSEFAQATLTVKPGFKIAQHSLVAALNAAGYHRRTQVDGPGQFSVRGDIVDIYPPDMDGPARMEFWGDEIEEIHSFDLVSQRREAKLKKMHISPAREVLFGDTEQAAQLLREGAKAKKGREKQRLQDVMEPDLKALDAGVMPEGMDRYLAVRYPKSAGITDYMPDAILLIDGPSAVREEAGNALFRAQEEQKTLLEEGLITAGLFDFHIEYAQLLSELGEKSVVYAENFARSIADTQLKESINLPAHTIPPWPGDVGVLADELRPLLHEGYFCAVLAGTPRGAKALARDLEAAGMTVQPAAGMSDVQPAAGVVAVLQGRLSAGVEQPAARFAIFTSRQQNAPKKQRAKAKNKGFSALSELKAGELVVHQSHGIGLYVGIQRLDMHGVVKDYLKVSYDKSDVLYVPVTQLDLLSRYTAPGDEEKVKLSRLGGEQWAKTKARVRKATDEMAKDLIELYARRRQAKGFGFSADTEWQRDFEARFEYEETADQLQAAQQIKTDMERTNPMDRLLAGDVGVGKTEVALRAAFKCVMGGKQCAILVPTTILAWQHYNTMLRRMEAFPVKVEMLSRFRTPKQVKSALSGMADGTVDIVVGTHKLLQKDIKFKDLGLLVVDEEQRFGVRHKEKLKQTFVGVDTLTLSATPIPRTLNMALSGIRDMSTMEQPPIERRPVESYVMEHDDGVIASAIKKELARAGQVYYIHNRIDTIDRVAGRLRDMLPEANVAVAHGRMDEEALSRTWQQLLDGEIDILVCTTLIETGVDVRNVNTLIVENADTMGLAQLYQIRGRVGRSGRKAYAYFTFRRDKVLSDVAAKRLSAIREFTAFGSGFRIAMRDLQIRGAGNLLGQSQSGHMEAVGYDLYVKMLNQAVAMAKGEPPPPDKAETLIDITIDAYLPESYIQSAAGRIEAYKRIAAIDSEADAADVLDELADRYGPVGEAAKGLVSISLLRVICTGLGIYEVNQQKDALLLYSDRLRPDVIRPLIKQDGLSVLFNAGAKPYLLVRVPAGQKPLEVLQLVVEKMALAEQA